MILGEESCGRGSQEQSPEAWGCRGQVEARWCVWVDFGREIVWSGVPRTEPRGLGVSGRGGGQVVARWGVWVVFGREIVGSVVQRTEPRGLGVSGSGGGQVVARLGVWVVFGREIVRSRVPRTEPRGLGVSGPGGGQVGGVGRFWARNRGVGGPKNRAQRPGGVGARWGPGGGRWSFLGEKSWGRGSEEQSPEAWGCRGQVGARWGSLVVLG